MKNFFISKKILVLTVFLAIIFIPQALANNLYLSGASVVSQDTSANTATLQFSIFWDNSWSDSANKDATWVFVKYSTDSGTTWNHATMKTSGTNPSGFSQGTGTGIDIVVSQDKKGCFIQRSSQGSGALLATSVQIVWDYAADGLNDSTATASTVMFKIFGIEMTYIPTGGFYVGVDATYLNGEIEWEVGSLGNINSEDFLDFQSVGSDPASYYYHSDADSDDEGAGSQFTVSQAYPKGFAAFYLMKYEITQGQYKDFLNTLSRAQQINRVASTISADTIVNIYVMPNSAAVTKRSIINAPNTGNGSTAPVVMSTTVSGVDKGDRACGYLSWMDLAAFLDWAALRPISELEFEKAARGPIYPANGDFAWGSTTITVAKTISGTENGTETITTASANACYNNTTFTGAGSDVSAGPLRVGIFATSSSTTRLTSGAGYYGNLDLSGNMWERPVTFGNSSGRSFAGTHGDGVLTTLSSYEGNATNLDWPGVSGTNTQGVTGASGSGFRGGSYTQAAARLIVADRSSAGSINSTRSAEFGGRGARTASA